MHAKSVSSPLNYLVLKQSHKNNKVTLCAVEKKLMQLETLTKWKHGRFLAFAAVTRHNAGVNQSQQLVGDD